MEGSKVSGEELNILSSGVIPNIFRKSIIFGTMQQCGTDTCKIIIIMEKCTGDSGIITYIGDSELG